MVFSRLKSGFIQIYVTTDNGTALEFTMTKDRVTCNSEDITNQMR